MRRLGMLRNLTYARAAKKDCLNRGEAPYASHLSLTQPGVLSDDDPVQRRAGIDAGFMWGKAADLCAVYTDLGWSEGMFEGVEVARTFGRTVEERTIHGWKNATAEHPAETLLRLGLFSETILDAIVAMDGKLAELALFSPF